MENKSLYLALFALEFFLGSLMFSYWLGRRQGRDLRKVRDGNPGAANLWRALGWRVGLAGLLLDYLKGFVPLVFIARSGLFPGAELALLAAAPVLGHAFSPFLKFSGGKSIAVTFGVWSAVTEWVVPTIMGGVFTLFTLARLLVRKGPASPREDAVVVFSAMTAVFVYTLVTGDKGLQLLWLINGGVLGFKHVAEVKGFRANIKKGGMYRT